MATLDQTSTPATHIEDESMSVNSEDEEGAMAEGHDVQNGQAVTETASENIQEFAMSETNRVASLDAYGGTSRQAVGVSLKETTSLVQDGTLDSINLSSLIEQQQQQQQASETALPQATPVTEPLPSASLSDILQDVPLETQASSISDKPDFELGDHVYQWCSLAGIPAVYQHHGIVLDVVYRESDWFLEIADFSNWVASEEGEGGDGGLVQASKRKKSLRSSKDSTGAGCIRTYHSSASETGQWYKVTYQAGFWKQNLSRSGTCTAVICDSPAMVRSRVQFLLENSHLLPPYSVVQSNCECVAVWCKTGTWATLQAAAWLHVTAAGQAKSAATLAGVAASTQVAVPAHGLWGWFGYTTTTSLAATQPYLIPAIAAYGVVTVGTPAVMLMHAKKKWKDLTIRLNESFWESAIDHPDIFVENITHWSIQHEPELAETR